MISNMAIVQIKMLSGHIPVKFTVKMVKTFFVPYKKLLFLATKLGIKGLRIIL